jgi:hypothetical protein
MKTLIAALLLASVSAHAGTPYFQHAVLTPSSIQAEFFTGAMKTNAGVSQVTLLPLFYRNAAPTDPWYKPSFAPLVIGGSAGGGSASAELGSVIDVGPQIISGFEGIVGTFSAPAKASVVSFFNCSASATACGSLSAGILGNLNIEQGGKFSTTWKQLGAHPIGYIIDPSILFK